MTPHSRQRRSLLRLLCFLTIAFATFSSCSLPKAPGEWSWDTHLRIPLGVRTYGLWDLAKSDSVLRERGSGIGMYSDSLLFFASFTDLKIALHDSLKIDPLEYILSKPLDALFVPANVNSSAELGDGQSMTFAIGAGIDTMIVDTGTVTIGLTNLAAGLTGNVHLELRTYNEWSYSLLDVVLPPGEEISRRISLHGFHLGSSAQMTMTSSNPADRVRVVVHMDTLQAEYYHGVITSQFVYADSSAALHERHRLTWGIIASGTLSVTAINETQLDDTIWIELPNLDRNGDTLRIRRFVPAWSQQSIEQDLVGYRLRLGNENPQRLAGRLLSISAPTSDPRYFEPGRERVSGIVRFSRLTFGNYSGVLENLEIASTTEGTSVESLPEGWDDVHPITVDAYVHLNPSVTGAHADVAVDVATLLRQAIVDSVHVEANDVYLGDDTTLIVNDLGRLIRDYPDSVRASSHLTLSGEITSAADDTISLTVELRAPLAFTLREVHSPGDVQRIETGNLQDIQRGTARVRVWNRLPVGGNAFLIVDRDSLDLLPSSGVDVDTVADIQIPVSDIVNGRTTGEAYTEFTVELSQSVIDLFRVSPFFVRTQLDLPGSNGDTLIAHGSDYVRVQVIAEIIYRFDTEGDE